MDSLAAPELKVASAIPCEAPAPSASHISVHVEAVDENTVVKLIQKVKHIKGFLKRPITVAEIENLVKAEKQPALIIESGDIVEMSSGPFKGERAKVLKIDEAKDEITVELIEVAVPIPVTVKSKMVKLFQKAGAGDDQY